MKKMEEKKASRKPKIKSLDKREKKMIESKVPIRSKYLINELPKR